MRILKFPTEKNNRNFIGLWVETLHADAILYGHLICPPVLRERKQISPQYLLQRPSPLVLTVLCCVSAGPWHKSLDPLPSPAWWIMSPEALSSGLGGRHSGMYLLMQVTTLGGKDRYEAYLGLSAEGLEALANYLLLSGLERSIHRAHNYQNWPIFSQSLRTS